MTGAFCHLCGTNMDEREVANPQAEGYCYDCETCDAPIHWFWDTEHNTLVLYITGERCPRCKTLVGQTQEVRA